MKNCKIRNCNRPVFKDFDTCILHCKKGDYQDDRLDGFLIEFYNEITKYISNKVLEHRFENVSLTENQIENFLKGTSSPIDSEISNFLKYKTVVFNQIIFPTRDNRDFFDFAEVLAKIGRIHFDTCEFYSDSIFLPETKVFFQDCVFNSMWFLYNYNVLENANDVIYQNCKFLKEVNTVVDDYSSNIFENNLFCNCEFHNQLSFDRLSIKGMIFKNFNQNKKYAQCISISRCIIESKFILNNYKIEKFDCEHISFNSEFEFQNNVVNSMHLFDTNFLNNFDCAETIFENLTIEKSIFNNYVGFQNCEFGVGARQNIDADAALFKYVTFKSFVNFRNTNFFSGLDIQNCNFIDPPNFLNTQVAYRKTNRETFRIIKYSFDRVGNYISANTFYEYEMKKYKEELILNKGNYSDKFLLFLYELFSNYGQSFIRPLVLISITSLLYWITVYGFENNLLYTIYPKANNIILSIAEFLNIIALGILPFKNMLKEGMEFLSLLFYITYSVLIWLVILAIKRKTKR